MLIQRGDRGDQVEDVQQALQDAGFDLAVDGIFGEQTEDAVRQFQAGNGLEIDGIVGSQTLITLGLNGPFGGTVDLRSEIVRIVNEERQRWAGKAETDADMTPVLQDYYATGVGEQIAAEDLQDPSWQENHPWSAVFISWVMRTAGAGDMFTYSRAHKSYIAAAKRNRESGNANNPFWAFRIDELAPKVGDLVCTARANSGATYDNIDEIGMKSTHCDVVVDIEPHRLTVVGGNVSQRVGPKNLTIDEQDGIKLSGNQSDYFAIIRIQEL